MFPLSDEFRPGQVFFNHRGEKIVIDDTPPAFANCVRVRRFSNSLNPLAHIPKRLFESHYYTLHQDVLC